MDKSKSIEEQIGEKILKVFPVFMQKEFWLMVWKMR